jgi:aspartyl-tRNA(Asn)/glutamyl-tRNA(Gln) amidotransferase subunit B
MLKECKNILDCYPEYEVVIGIEVHTQLKTKSKVFCSCPNQYGDSPNKNTCPICAGHPGTLPVLNRTVVDFAIKAGLATHCEISKVSDFVRKHYNYPDLPKNFQITQGDKPICKEGYIPIDMPDGTEKKIRLNRIHIEEDSGKNIHTEANCSFVDLNRAGTPLLEWVSYPDISSAFEANEYLTRLHSIVRYIDISNANMDEGSFRADINISIKKKSQKKLGTRVELKNINSFKFIRQAIDYEIERQIKLLESGKSIKEETRLWDSKKHTTFFMRTKDSTDDYRFMSEPDLPLIIIDQQWLKRIKPEIPELPHQKFHRFQKEYSLSASEVEALIDNPQVSNFFEKTILIYNKPKQVCNWLLRDVLGFINEYKKELSEVKITPETFAELIAEIDKGIINSKVAQGVFIEMATTGKYPSIIIQEKGLKQIESVEKIEPVILEIIKNNPEQVEKYRAGKERLFTFFVGQAMKTTKGKANPKTINELLKKYLNKN